MKKITKIKAKDLWIKYGVFTEIECWKCGREETIIEEDEESLLRKIQEDGWRILNSKEYKTVGPICEECAKEQ